MDSDKQSVSKKVLLDTLVYPKLVTTGTGHDHDLNFREHYVSIFYTYMGTWSDSVPYGDNNIRSSSASSGNLFSKSCFPL